MRISRALCFSFLLLILWALPALAAPTPITSDTFINIVKKSKPGVAHIESVVKMTDRFGREVPEFRNLQGSGLLIQHKGTIKVLTNRHVIQGSIQLSVTVLIGQSSKKVDAEIEAQDTYTDLALISLKTRDPEFLAGLRTIPLGNSNEVKEGEWVMAMGNPRGLAFTSHRGIVSALGRSLFMTEKILPHDFIQIDATISPGNSGGPLLNLKGEVIGIVTLAYGADPDIPTSGIGFAIPINIARDFLEKRVRGKSSTAPAGWIGVLVQTPEEELLNLFGHPKGSQGLIVADIVKPSPAAKVGLKQGDMVVGLRYNGNEESFQNPAEFERVISGIPPGSSIIISYLRRGKKYTVTLLVGARPS